MPLSKSLVLSTLQRVRDAAKKRKFLQAVELAINFKGIDFKKQENRVDVIVQLPHATGKTESKVAVFARDQDFAALLKGKVPRVIMEEDISKIDKKAAALLVEEFDAFLAEGSVMLTVGKHLGQVLAPKGKMPTPVQPNLNSFQNALKGIKSGVRVTNKKGKFMPVVQVVVGKEDMSDEFIAENIIAAHEAVANVLGTKEQNIKNAYLKFTMSPSFKIAAEGAKPA